MGKLYNKDSIESLDPLSFTRLKPQVYCGNTEYATQLLVEIISNSVDEFRLGHGNVIDIVLKDNEVAVFDEGQGFICNEIREDGKSVLEAAFSVLNTSGKYREDGTYEGTSLGSFGIGSKLPIFLSHKATVQSWRDGKTEKIEFVEGVFSNREVKTDSSHHSGTMVNWVTSEQFFDHPTVDIKTIKSLLHTISCLCSGLKIKLNNNGDITEYYSENGLDDYVDAQINNKELLNNRMRVNYVNGKYAIDLILTYAEGYSATVVPFVNCGLTDSGSHITTIKSLVTREFNKFFKSQNWLKEKDENLAGEDINEGLYIAFNITAPSVAYDAQVKSRITKIDMSSITEGITSELQSWLLINEKEIKKIFDKAVAAKKAREAAKKAREAARGVNKKQEKKRALKFDSKLADCYSKDRSKCEIFIVEGDSAGGNLKMARNNEFTAVMPIRGKILNVRKATLDKIQKNAEIMTMINAFGLTVDPKTMKLTYHKSDLRYGKIIIESDADVDGAHIKNLFYTFIWTFCPQLIMDGYIYAGVPPLYKITEGKDTYIYLKDDAALEEYRNKNAGKKYIVNRLKGLGEMSMDETSILVDEDKRIIKQVTVDDVKAADALFDKLMGDSALPRKMFIKENSEKAEYGV